MRDDQCVNKLDGRILSECICISDHHTVYFKYLAILSVIPQRWGRGDNAIRLSANTSSRFIDMETEAQRAYVIYLQLHLQIGQSLS